MIVEKPIYQTIDVGNYTITLLTKEEYLKNKELIPSVKSLWWLRSPGIGVNRVAIVYGEYGNVYSAGGNVYVGAGVRPAFKIEHCGQLKLGEKVIIKDSYFTVLNDGTFILNTKDLYFTVLNDGILLCDTIVDETMFDKASNNYDKSYIKQWLEKWAEDKLSGKREALWRETQSQLSFGF